jgi:hypothetical protein
LLREPVQYKVSYFQRDEYGGRAEFVSESVYKEPIALEVAEEHERLPAIREMKSIEFPADVTGRRRKPSTRSKLRKSDTVSELTLKIHYPYLLNVLKSIIEYSAEQPTGGNQGLDASIFLYPYMDLYLHLEELLEYKTGDSELRGKHSDAYNKLADDHIDLLQSYLMSQPAVQYNEAKARSSGSTPLTTFGTFWLLMEPGTDFYKREADGSVNRYVLDRLSSGPGKDTNGEKVTITYSAQVWNLVLDEKAIRRFVRKVDIEVFDDERAIAKLPVFPVQYLDDHDGGSTRQALIQRGHKYFAFSKKPSLLQYDGHGLKPGSRSVSIKHHDAFSLLHPPSPLSSPPPPPPPLEGVPTAENSIRLAPCECSDCKVLACSQETYARLTFSEYRKFIPARQTDLSEHQCSLLPSHMFAFILNDRAYGGYCW